LIPPDANLPRGDIGEIWIHGGSVIKGYWNNPRATAESFTAGYWHSGDLGSIDEQNFVRVFDRQKDMINRGGLKIYSAEVESVLAGHPAVVERHYRTRLSGAGRAHVHAVVVVRSDIDLPALRAVRRAHVGLQSTGDHRHRHRAAAAQRQWQGDEESPRDSLMDA
jgi:acyl-CoA synthetase (AMP-forming)/AMP-acid ligase II